jgi:hypothetical protein
MELAMILSRRALGTAIGLVWGLSVMMSTWILILRKDSGAIISQLSNFYLGYSFSWTGSIIGFLWGFVDGFIGGFLIAWIYNIVYKSVTKHKAR